MRLLLNAGSTAQGGSIQVARSVVEELAAVPDIVLAVAASPGLARMLDVDRLEDRVRVHTLLERPAQRLKRGRDPSAALRAIGERFRPDVVFTTSGPAYWRPPVPHLIGFNLPHYVYPDSPFFAEVLGPVERMKWKLKGSVIQSLFLRDGDAFVVQTDDVRDRLRAMWPGRTVVTVSNTVAAVFERYAAQAPVRRGGLRILMLSASYRHKQLGIINQVVRALHTRGMDGVEVWLTLPDDEYEATVDPDLRGSIKNRGPQKPQDCPALYEACDVVFLPSLLECFSANYVEAMAVGRPIVTTDLGFAHAVCRDAALYFDPMSADAAAAQLQRVAEDARLWERLVALGRERLRAFNSASERAAQYLGLCEELVTRGGRHVA